MVSCNLSFFSEHKGSLCAGMQWSQTVETASVSSSAHQGLLFQAFLVSVHTAFVVSSPVSFPSQQAAWRGWGKAARWFCEGEGRENNLSAAWVFTNKKSGLEIKNSYGNFYFSLHLKNPQPSEAQALFWVKFLAQSLKMWAVCTLEQQTCYNYLCKLSICEACFTWGGSVAPLQQGGNELPALHGAAGVWEKHHEMLEKSQQYSIFFYWRAQYISISFKSIAETPSVTDATLLLCFCSVHHHLIHQSGFMLRKIRN